MNIPRQTISRIAPALRSDDWRAAILMICALALLVASGALTGTFRAAENRADELASSLFSREASGQIHVVEMDAASMAAIRRWPWPRDHYAEVIRQLDAAGVRSISFDVDFSSSGDSAGDAAMDAAIAVSIDLIVCFCFATKCF